MGQEQGRRLLAAAFALAIGAAGAQAAPVEVRRTTDGIPHVKAQSWRDLGHGIGHVQAEDALCTLADAFVTLEGRPANLDLDFFFRTIADDAAVARLRADQPPELRELVEGFAAGYNAQLRVAKAQKQPASCASAPWLREIGADDIYRRMIVAGAAAGASRFIVELTNAQPNRAAADAAPQGRLPLPQRLALHLGEQPDLGSNMIGFGRQVTGEQGGLLFGNPHWYWGGPDRFYQMHLTLPGQLDVAGVTFLGIPVVMLGFNAHVAWSHTVSAARRFGLFDLALDPQDPTRYLVDGRSEAMEARNITVETRSPGGVITPVTRTLYSTRYGPMVDLGAIDQGLRWGRHHAFALRDVNRDNTRIFRNYLQWGRAQSLEEFIAIQQRELAIPWVNTVAIGQGRGQTWFADIGAVPNAPDSLRQACATPLSRIFATLDPYTPVLDGSRADCNWLVDPAAPQAGVMPAARLPQLLREDHVANMNDSYWLTNPAQALESYDAVLGGERKALSWRGQAGHALTLQLASKPATSSAELARSVMHETLVPKAHTAVLFKPELLGPACTAPSDTRIQRACTTLQRWGNQANADDQGAVLWNSFLIRLNKLVPEHELFTVPFSAEDPLATPRQPNGADPRVAEALAGAVQDLDDKGWKIDERLGRRQFVNTGGEPVAVHGGCGWAGYFNVMCNYDGSYQIGPLSVGNSYLQVVHFGPQGVQAHTQLAHGLKETAVDKGFGSAPVLRYARKQWLKFPFTEAEIARDPALKRSVLNP
jgi:acyl-homoserine-lactone acylase